MGTKLPLPAQPVINLTWEEFEEQFKPIANIISDDERPYRGTMFETFGAELAKVQEVARAHPGKVWTWVDGDDDGHEITNGYHYVNRIGYFITAIAADPGTIYIIEP